MMRRRVCRGRGTGTVLGGQRKRSSVLTEEALGRPHGRGEAGALVFTRTQRWSGAGIGSESNRRSVPSCTWGTLSLSRLPFVISSHPPTPTPNNQNQTLLNPPCSGKICFQYTTLLFLNSIKSYCLSHILDCLLPCSLIVILML